MKNKYFYINTIGCQMNVYDSDNIASSLVSLGYNKTDSYESADLIIINTCTIREKAKEKAFSFIGRLNKLKKKNPDLIIGVGGCVAQQEKEKIFTRMPHVNFVFGTHTISNLPDIIKKVKSGKNKIIDVQFTSNIHENSNFTNFVPEQAVSKFITIMRGCENYCTYCVVPSVRGKEISRKPDAILKEINYLVNSGVKEITLLGQNVNSYGKKENLCSFPRLLSMVNDISKLKRIRFTTSHPKDLTEGLVASFNLLDKLCNHIHLPVQSGSNKILKKMNRKYTVENYLNKIDNLRRVCPDIAISSDIIVGFPGESISDFNETTALIKEVEFDGLFVFGYSDRQNTQASSFPDKLPEKEKNRRLNTLLDIQEKYSRKKNSALINSVQHVLIEGLSKKQKTAKSSNGFLQWTGRTSSNKIVNFEVKNNIKFNDCYKVGNIVEIKIEKAFNNSLKGVPLHR